MDIACTGRGYCLYIFMTWKELEERTVRIVLHNMTDCTAVQYNVYFHGNQGLKTRLYEAAM